MFWGSFSARVTQCSLIKVKSSTAVFIVLFAGNLCGVTLVVRPCNHIAQDCYKTVLAVNTGTSTFIIFSVILGK